MRGQKKLSILLLADDVRGHANTVLDHIASYFEFSKHEFYLYNPRGLEENRYIKLDEFDVVVVHYSLSIIHTPYLAKDLREKLRNYQGLKIQYIQDDYRRVNEYTDMMRYIGVDILFTPFPTEIISLVYDEQRLPGTVKYTTLTGYVPERYRNFSDPPLESRPIDVGYRGRNIPFWLGMLGQEKTWIGQGFLEHSKKYDIKCDIRWEEQDRIYGEDWDKFISSCKAMLGTEGGASITDFDGTVEKKTKAYLEKHPGADFWEVHKNVLRPYEGNLVGNKITPRVFECAAHRTAMILFPGEYSGIIRPWEHYIPLKKDFSNVGEVIEKLDNIESLKRMTTFAYEDLIASGRYSYRKFIREFDEVIERHYRAHPIIHSSKVSYWMARLERSEELSRVAAQTIQIQLQAPDFSSQLAQSLIRSEELSRVVAQAIQTQLQAPDFSFQLAQSLIRLLLQSRAVRAGIIFATILFILVIYLLIR